MHECDLTLLKELVCNIKDNIIRDGAYISPEVIDYLTQVNSELDINVLFEKKPSGKRSRQNSNTYYVDCYCNKCNTTFTKKEVNKTTLFDIIKSGDFMCEECKQTSKEKEKKENELEINRKRYERNQKRKEGTNEFISNYLDPNKSWKESVTLKDRFNEIYSAFVDWGTIEEYIKNMSYKDFLQTPYWKAVAGKAKQVQHYKCQLCGINKNLVTHHRTYEHHGLEHLYLKTDLITLCSSCHEKFHDISE